VEKKCVPHQIVAHLVQFVIDGRVILCHVLTNAQNVEKKFVKSVQMNKKMVHFVQIVKSGFAMTMYFSIVLKSRFADYVNNNVLL
jgi:hypothetical protein